MISTHSFHPRKAVEVHGHTYGDDQKLSGACLQVEMGGSVHVAFHFTSNADLLRFGSQVNSAIERILKTMEQQTTQETTEVGIVPQL